MNRPIVSSLSTATALFRRWRSTRKRGERIPEDLWTAASAAAREHGVSRTSLALGLAYHSLKSRLGDAPGTPVALPRLDPRASATVAPAFVELPYPAVGATVACTIVMDQASNEAMPALLRIELPSITTTEIAALIDHLRRRP